MRKSLRASSFAIDGRRPPLHLTSLACALGESALPLERKFPRSHDHSMTIPLRKRALLLSMHLNPYRLAVACLILATATARAEEQPTRDLLRDGLYAEEVTRDVEAAAKSYEQVLARHTEQRAFAASALFRLAEVRRKQDRKEDAIQLYQRLFTEFPGAAAETKIAMENLAALGGKVPEMNRLVGDAESVEMARLKSLAKDAPDIILDPKTLEQAVTNGWSKVVAHLLAAGSQPFAGDGLRIAVEKGYLEIVRQLTAGDGPVPAQVVTAGIQTAIKFNRYTILDFLLQRGFKPGGMTGDPNVQGASAVAYALLTGKSQCAEILLKHGVDLDAISGDRDSSGMPGGTALQRVIGEGKFDAANWLLDKGAKPDIPSHEFGITPLREAVLQSSDGVLAIMQRLLEAGADPNRRTGVGPNFNENRLFRNATPLALALQANLKSSEKIRLLLKHGADPKLDNQLIKVLLERNQPDSMESLKLLLDAGASLDAKWMKDNMAKQNGEAREFLVEKFILPSFVKAAEIQLVINDRLGIENSSMAVRSGDAAPPDLGAWLLANHENSQWARTNNKDDNPLNYQWRIWRKWADGALTQQVVDFSGDASLPLLQWGDVVECRITHGPGSSGASGSHAGLPPQEVARLRRRIAFPITFEIDGVSREIIVRGDRVIFDPTKNEVPLGNLQNVVWFLWQPGWNRSSGPIIHLTRKGWPDVRLSYDSKEADKFQLQAGDRVRVEVPEQLRTELAAMRRESIILKVAGYPFAKSFGRTEGGKPVAASIPTLIQALVDTQVPRVASHLARLDQTVILYKGGFYQDEVALIPNWKDLAKNKTLDLAALSEEHGPFYQFSLLPHPDLAKLRIRRLQDDGGEKVIDVNLAEIIASSTDQTTPEEARKADVVLQIGDVVEVSLLKDRLSEQWKGFAAREEVFFAKALSGRVRITDKDGGMAVRDLIFRAPRFQETEIGWVPLPPETGIPSMRGSWLIGDYLMETNQGTPQSETVKASEFFLRDGDAAVLTDTLQPQPRPVVVPPPSR